MQRGWRVCSEEAPGASLISTNLLVVLNIFYSLEDENSCNFLFFHTYEEGKSVYLRTIVLPHCELNTYVDYISIF